MKITADGMVCEIKHGESLLDAVKKLELDMFTLRHRPLAAQIGGEVFSLWRYIFCAMERIWAGGCMSARFSLYS